MKSIFKKLLGSASEADSAEDLSQISELGEDQLRQIIANSENEQERARHEKILGMKCGSTGLAPLPSDSAEVWLAAIGWAREQGYAINWLDQVSGEDYFERIAVNARLAEVRLSAAKRLSEIERIARLATLSRRKDRVVYQYCKTALKQKAAAAKRAERIALMCEELRQLLVSQPFSNGQLYELRKQFDQFDEGPDLAECHELFRQAGQRRHEETSHIRDLSALLTQAKAFLDELNDVFQLDPLHHAKQLELLARLDGLHDSMYSRSEYSELTALMSLIRERVAVLDKDARCLSTCQGFLAGIEDQEFRPSVETDWYTLPKPVAQELRAFIQSEWLSVLRSRLSESPDAGLLPAVQQDSGFGSHAFSRLLDVFENAIAESDHGEALELAGKLDRMSLEFTPPADLAEDHQELLARLARLLGDARRKSDDLVRERLVAEAEALLTGGMDTGQMALAIPGLSTQWQSMAGEDDNPPEHQERFERALTKAYEKVVAEQQAELARLNTAHAGKSMMLDQAEAWLANLTEPTNPAELQNRLGELRHEWAELDKSAPGAHPDLRKRFMELHHTVSQRVQPYVEAELRLRSELLEAARLVELEPDSRKAMAQARKLLERWRSEVGTVQAPRERIANQWKTFKAAIDNVAARREAERKEIQARQAQAHRQAG